MLLNKNKRKVENKAIDNKEQKREAEKGIESIRRFNQINGEIKKTYDEMLQKQNIREKHMCESLLKAEAKYLNDEVGETSRAGESSRDRESSSGRDKDSD